MLDGDVFRIQLIYPRSIFDTGTLCLEDGYVTQLVGDSWFAPASTSSNCNPLGHYAIDSSTGIIMAETPSLPQGDYYTLIFDELRGDTGQIYENFSVYCGDKVYDFPDDVDGLGWRWKNVTCHFNEGVNNFNFTSTDSESCKFDSFRISRNLDDLEIEFFTEGPTLSKPKTVKVERNDTYIKNNKATIKIRITFI